MPDGFGLLDITYGFVRVFGLVLLRVSGIFAASPVFGSTRVPALVKAGLAAVVSLIVAPLVMPEAGRSAAQTMGAYAGQAVGELLLGLSIGFVGSLVFAGVQLAGQVIDIQMGFSMVSVVDPGSGAQMTVVGQMKYLLATLVFLAVNGHHVVLSGIINSFDLVRPGTPAFSPELVAVIVRHFRDLFVVAVRVALPAAGTVFLVEAGLGVISKMVPQMNALISGFPLRIGAALIALALSLAAVLSYLADVFRGLDEGILEVLKAMSGG